MDKKQIRKNRYWAGKQADEYCNAAASLIPQHKSEAPQLSHKQFSALVRRNAIEPEKSGDVCLLFVNNK